VNLIHYIFKIRKSDVTIFSGPVFTHFYDFLHNFSGYFFTQTNLVDLERFPVHNKVYFQGFLCPFGGIVFKI
jgi:hypothetical protein